MDLGLSGKVAIVTGSSRGLGLAAATALAEEGASVRDVEHDRAFAGDDVSQVIVRCVIETRDFEHIERVKARLAREGFGPI